jgi:hypothetical protein
MTLGAAPAPAPAVLAGAPLDLQDIPNSAEGLRVRKVLREMKLISADSVASAEVRHHAIVVQHASAKYPGIY